MAEEAELDMGDQGGGEEDMGPMKDKRGGGQCIQLNTEGKEPNSPL